MYGKLIRQRWRELGTQRWRRNMTGLLSVPIIILLDITGCRRLRLPFVAEAVHGFTYERFDHIRCVSGIKCSCGTASRSVSGGRT